MWRWNGIAWVCSMSEWGLVQWGRSFCSSISKNHDFSIESISVCGARGAQSLTVHRKANRCRTFWYLLLINFNGIFTIYVDRSTDIRRWMDGWMGERSHLLWWNGKQSPLRCVLSIIFFTLLIHIFSLLFMRRVLWSTWTSSTARTGLIEMVCIEFWNHILLIAVVCAFVFGAIENGPKIDGIKLECASTVRPSKYKFVIIELFCGANRMCGSPAKNKTPSNRTEQ